MGYGYYFHHFTEEKLKCVARLSHLSLDTKQVNISAMIQNRAMRLGIPHSQSFHPVAPSIAKQQVVLGSSHKALITALEASQLIATVS